MSVKTDAATRLLAAEAEYLTACDWRPIMLGGRLCWQQNNSAKITLLQEKAVKWQKKTDNWPEVRDDEEERSVGSQARKR